MSELHRRDFLAASAGFASLVGSGTLAGAAMNTANPRPTREGDAHRGPRVIASGNGLAATARAMELLQAGERPVDAVVAGVKIVEDDPNDMSVGYGGLPNEDGIVELDASVMDGPLHRAGSVAALRNIKNPAAVALQVMRRTDHVMLVGEGALKFARAMGFKEEDLLTDAAREAWLKWKANLGKNDDWLNDDEREDPRARAQRNPPGVILPDSPIPFTWGTINCSAVDARGDLGSCTTTSGLSYKLSGRIGDSPIVGAGMYADNAIGAAGATGRGEAVIQVCGAFSTVLAMEDGLAPTEACLSVLKRMADRTREKRLLNDRGQPNFNVTLYALRKDGAYGSASLRKGGSFAIHDGTQNRVLPSEFLFE